MEHNRYAGARLDEAPRVYQSAECATFRFTRDARGPYSNFWQGSTLHWGGLEFATGEALYNAFKHALDPARRAAIAAAPTPKEAKRLGRLRPITQAGWDQGVRVRAMRITLRVKFAADTALLRRRLAEDRGRPIVEVSRFDGFFGIPQ